MHFPFSHFSPPEQMIVVGSLTAPQIHSCPDPQKACDCVTLRGQSKLTDMMNLKTEWRRLSWVIQVAQSNHVSP